MQLKSEASLQISKPVATVFEAVIKKDKLTKYFISESTGDLQEGVDLIWKFPEFKERFPITKVKVIENKLISFVWDPETVVKIAFTGYTPHSTIVTIHEGAKSFNETNLKWLVSNSGGWANFLASLKAFVEYDVQLRKGAFDFMGNMND